MAEAVLLGGKEEVTSPLKKLTPLQKQRAGVIGDVGNLIPCH